MDLIWGKGVASTDAWAGSLAGAVVETDASRVTHLVVRRGLVFPTRYLAPVERLSRCDAEGLYLDMSILEVLGLPRSGGPGAEPLTPSTRVFLDDGASVRLKGLRLKHDHFVTDLIISPRRLGHDSLLVCLDRAVAMGAGRIAIAAGKEDLKGLPAYRADGAIESDIWEALYASADVSDVDLKGIRVAVVDGAAALHGNVRASLAAESAERVARSVPGVASVETRLVTDWDIDLAAASYISTEAPQLADGVKVQSHLGRVTLSGHVPSMHLIGAMVHGIHSIPGVRGVDDQLEIRSGAPVREPLSLEDEAGPQGDAA